MTWFYLTLLSALFWSAVDILSKWISKDMSDLTSLWIRFVYSIPFFSLVWLFIDTPAVSAKFWFILLILYPMEILVWVLYLRAIRISPLSTTIPFLGLTPVFLLVVPWILLGEQVSLIGGLGVVTIAAGIYMLNLNQQEAGILEPFKAVRREKGSLLMIAVAIIFSVLSTVGKMAIIESSPMFFAGVYYPVLGVLLTPYVLSNSESRKEIKSHPWKSLLVGMAFAMMALAHFYAIEIAKVAYMIAVKRTSLIYSTILGYLFFKEKNIRQRLIGVIIIVIGVFLIASD
jgi:drug/metabolite transporter (DMT)-like permease